MTELEARCERGIEGKCIFVCIDGKTDGKTICAHFRLNFKLKEKLMKEAKP